MMELARQYDIPLTDVRAHARASRLEAAIVPDR
jgi:hypothetical protein